MNTIFLKSINRRFQLICANFNSTPESPEVAARKLALLVYFDTPNEFYSILQQALIDLDDSSVDDNQKEYDKYFKE